MVDSYAGQSHRENVQDLRGEDIVEHHHDAGYSHGAAPGREGGPRRGAD
jgi:hypothetical protein